MAIYRLGDISIIKNGTTPSTKNKELWKNEIPFFGPSELKSMKTKRFITKKINKLKRKGTTLISTTATIGNIGFLKRKAWFNQQITSIEPNNEFILDKYLYYYFLKNKEKIKNMKDGGSIFTILKINIFKNWKILIPSLKIQKQIIDIIEPFENQIKILIDFKSKISFLLWNLNLKKTKNKIDILNIKTGKLNTNVIDIEGEYNFYSCSNKIMKSNHNSFKGKYALLSGNGELYTWWKEGEFDLYQRVYGITFKKDFFTNYFSLQKSIKKLRSNSSGSVIKYIKLNDIKKIIKYDNHMENGLNKIYLFLKNIDDLLMKLNFLKKHSLKLLIK